jgi:UPF0042 nucleotide-binding protein
MVESPVPLQIVWISGLSGSGKTTAIKTLEDIGFFCIDNLPIVLLPTFIDLIKNSKMDINKIGLVVDIREQEFLKDVKNVIAQIKALNATLRIFFLESSDEILITRFKTTRRQHPLAPSGKIIDGIRKERVNLSFLKEMADQTIDTSNLSIHELRRQIIQTIAPGDAHQKLSLTFLSFGFKYGLPAELDLLFDVRFLPNPFFVEELKNLTGLDESVRNFILDRGETSEFLTHVEEILNFLIPQYLKEGKAYLTVGIGCTGGVHRSVVIARELKNRFSSHLKDLPVHIMDGFRDIG